MVIVKDKNDDCEFDNEQLERDLQNDINNLCNDDLESKSVEKSDAQQIEEQDDEPIYDETPQTIPSIVNKDEKLDLRQCNKEKEKGKILGKMSFDLPSFKLISQLTPEGYKEAKTMQNETEEDKGEVDINKLIKENNILDAESEKTTAGSRIGVSNVLSPLTITVVEKVEDDMGKKQREEINRKLPKKFCSPYENVV
ncbi:hypothetical protein L1987_64412 [Smallanthus sonchifolius]|uniref:Uncharacterized protein n=1 Tax=Smallanthus sonchifolius TaxID=185202 RepID=A0ACB9CFZ0_9ASTR|nr:hypothetical protein L1987_64412 [Smallanthus sonchifolius]